MPKAKRAHVNTQLVREHIYAFSAVCPLAEDSYSIIAPQCNTAARIELLHGLSAAYPQEDIVLFADNAGWHRSKELNRPANIRIELLPPCSPELNPTAHLWDYIREQKDFNNHIFESMDPFFF